MKIAIRILMGAVLAGLMVGCRPQAPAASSFTIPAVGTLMPGGNEDSFQPNLPPSQSGALIINHTPFQIQIAVSNTIATVQLGQNFLFVLPPNTYEFYIYEPDNVTLIQKETLEVGKLRYLYLEHNVPGGG